MAKGSMYSILLDAEFDTKQIQRELAQHQKDIKLKVDTTDAQRNVEDLGLTFNVANDIFQKSIDLIGKFTNEVANLDSALVEFRKVSELSGASLDRYVDKLSTMGQNVARTGKPNRSEPVCHDGKVA